MSESRFFRPASVKKGRFMERIIEIEGLNKAFGEVKAVSDLSFHVDKGEMFAFLGVNGAGKSTTISIMCGTLEKDSGKVMICGKNADEELSAITREIGVVFQSSVLDGALSVKDNLLSRASLYGIFGAEAEARVTELANLLDFKNLLSRTLKNLSGGQRRRIDVARALLHRPSVLILDEPTTGLDPQTRKKLWEVIENLRKEEKMTVFLTTHYMEETADADYVVIIDGGKIVAEGTPLALKNKYAGDYITLYGADEAAAKKLGKAYEKIQGAIRISVDSTEEAKNLIISYPEVFIDFEIVKGKMDDVFLAATGKKLAGGN